MFGNYSLATKPNLCYALYSNMKLLTRLMFSNWSRMNDADKNKKLEEAVEHVDLSMYIAEFQRNNGAFYAFEHPQGFLAG